jgi:thiosulfate/3-mercaptopyruvate sulfurtransferase
MTTQSATTALPTPLVTTQWLAANLDQPDLLLFDCRFAPVGPHYDPAAGALAYAAGHIPGAHYLHLEHDLSGPKQPSGHGGRHPLPDPATLAARLGALGLSNSSQVVVYSDHQGGGAMFASRLWWLLRWLGHEAVAVLDGGLAAWRATGGSLSPEVPTTTPQVFTVNLQHDLLASHEQVKERNQQVTLIDSRARARYLGEIEPIDKRAGHIAGAINHDWSAGLDSDGHFLAASAQTARFADLPKAETIVYCGSGVSACGNLLALALAGHKLGAGGVQLYAGSWSDWVAREG